MARISKRTGKKTADNFVKKTIYRTAIYGRISDDSTRQEIDSVDNQFFICKEYIEKRNLETQYEHFEIVDFYGDYGKTGTNFERDEFKRMLEDVRLGIVNCIVVKDSSRFGRNHLEVGNYIERIFPFLGVRFIAVTDGIDTFAPDFDSKEFVSEIKNLVNEMYSKDAAIKANSIILHKRQMGSHVGGRAPYGYLRLKIDGIYRLVPDENTASIVKKIFELFVELKNYTKLTLELQKLGLNIPTNYLKTRRVYVEEGDSRPWSTATLNRMLRNEAYIGHWVPGDEKYRKEYAHEAIIEKDLFERVQKVMAEIYEQDAKRRMVQVNDPLPEDEYYDVLYCGVCGGHMYRSSRYDRYHSGCIKRRIQYLCYKSKHEPNVCKEKVYISKVFLDEIVLSEFQVLFVSWLKRPSYYKKQVTKTIENKRRELEAKLKDLDYREQHLAERQYSMYLKYIESDMESSEYLADKNILLEEQRKIVLEKAEIESQQKELHRTQLRLKRSLDAIMGYKSEKILSKVLIDSLIESIHVYPDKRVDIVWSFGDEWSKGGV